MWTGKWELVVKTNDETEVYEYETIEEAVEIQKGMEMALGNQLCWVCIRPQMMK